MALLMIVVSASRHSDGQSEQHGTYGDQLETVVGRELFPISSDPVSERPACTAQCQGKWLAYGNLVLEEFSDFQLGYGGTSWS